MKFAFLVVLVMLAMMFVAGCTVPGTRPEEQPKVTDLTVALDRFTTGVNTTLQGMDQALASAAADLGRTGISGPEANATLAQLAASLPLAEDAATISAEGRIAAVMPEKYWGAVGVYVGNESHNRQALEEKRPLMSPIFPAAEGFDAVSIRWPVWDEETGAYLGLVSVLVDPQQLLADRADRALAGTNFTAWAIDTEGRLIYDRDPAELVGKNMTTDPAFAGYPELVALTTRMTVEPAGSGTYTFTPEVGGSPVRKEAVWATVGLHGTDWRLLVAREI
jgi:HK/GC/Chemotaxis protein-like, sensor domain